MSGFPPQLTPQQQKLQMKPEIRLCQIINGVEIKGHQNMVFMSIAWVKIDQELYQAGYHLAKMGTRLDPDPITTRSAV